MNYDEIEKKLRNNEQKVYNNTDICIFISYSVI